MAGLLLGISGIANSDVINMFYVNRTLQLTYDYYQEKTSILLIKEINIIIKR